ncbi:MAG: SLC13 family permease [Acidobacteriota bacterium]|nr:SLC13 family permease [Acidobacteriota bacterium]
MTASRMENGARVVGLWLGPAIAAVLLLIPDLEPGNPVVNRMAAVALWMAVWWMAESVPLAITSLLPIVLFPVLGIMNGKTASQQYINDIIFLFLGGFIVALAMEKWHLHKRIALNILVRVGNHPRGVLLGFMGATWFLSMWISNTATTMMMVPIALALIVNLGDLMEKVHLDRYAVGLFLGIAYSASIGGIATLVGTPPNLLFSRFYSELFPNLPELTFADWMIFALPFSTVFLLLVWRFLCMLFTPKHHEGEAAGATFRKYLDELGAIRYEEKVVAVCFSLLALLWLTRRPLDIGMVKLPGWSQLFANPGFFNDGTVSILLAVILFLIPDRNGDGKIMDWKTAKKLPWDIVLLFGGGFALAKGFIESGLSEWVAQRMAGAEAWPLFLVVFLICFTITFLTELTSNTATTQIFLPLLATFAVTLEVHPILMMVPTTLACSFAFMLPVATPPNAIVFGSGLLRISDMARTGLAINLLGIVMITLYTWFFGPVLFGVDLTAAP